MMANGTIKDNNNKLIKHFLKTAMALNSFNEAFYFLGDKFNEFQFINQALMQNLNETENELEEYEIFEN